MDFKSHLNTVILAINTIIHLREAIIKQFKPEITDEIIKEAEKYSEFVLELSITKELLAGCLIVAESSDKNKKQLLKLIDGFMESDNFNKYVSTYIRDKKSAEKVALSLSFISMYADYLDGKEWIGPKLSQERFESRFKVRKLYKVDTEDFINTSLSLMESKEYIERKKLLERLDKSDLVNEVLAAYMIINTKKEDITELNSYITQLGSNGYD